MLIDTSTCSGSGLRSRSQFQPTRKGSTMDEEYEVKYSQLCRVIERDGKSVEVEIYEDGEGGWILEVVDEHDNSTVWDEPFETDQEALDEVDRTIEEEGIDSLIGPPSTMH